MKCRACFESVEFTFADLRTSPPSNSFIRPEDLEKPEVYYPLNVKVCHHCWLAQIDEYKHHAEIFSQDYVYFSSFSSSWVERARLYVESMVSEFKPSADSFWIEVASNDGYLLQHVRNRGIKCLGIEPTQSTAKAAREKGIDTISEFFGVALAEKLYASGQQADLMTANNVLAHVPDLRDFLNGFKIILKPQGIATFEFPHLLNLLQLNQFDTVYHEHFSYLSILSLGPLLEKMDLRIFRVEKVSTHGGSLRVFVCHSSAGYATEQSVENVLMEERLAGIANPEIYKNFQRRINRVKTDLLQWLIEKKRTDKKICGYGAAAKGNTLLNYSGIGTEFISVVADASPHKQGLYLPGSRIPVVSMAALVGEKPDALLIFAWNLVDEILPHLRKEFGSQLEIAVAIPRLQIL